MQHSGQGGNRSSLLKDLLKRCWKNTWFPLSSFHLFSCLTLLPSPPSCFHAPSFLLSHMPLSSLLFAYPPYTSPFTPPLYGLSPHTTTLILPSSPSHQTIPYTCFLVTSTLSPLNITPYTICNPFLFGWLLKSVLLSKVVFNSGREREKALS